MKEIKDFLVKYFGLFDIGFVGLMISLIIWGFVLKDANTVFMVGTGIILTTVWFFEAVIRILKNEKND